MVRAKKAWYVRHDLERMVESMVRAKEAWREPRKHGEGQESMVMAKSGELYQQARP